MKETRKVTWVAVVLGALAAFSMVVTFEWPGGTKVTVQINETEEEPVPLDEPTEEPAENPEETNR